MNEKNKTYVLVAAALVIGVFIGAAVVQGGLVGEAYASRASKTTTDSVIANSCNADDVCEAKSLKVGTQSILIGSDNITHSSATNTPFEISSTNSVLKISSPYDLAIRGGGVAISSDSSMGISAKTALYIKNLPSSKPNIYINSYYLCIDSYGQVFRQTTPCV